MSTEAYPEVFRKFPFQIGRLTEDVIYTRCRTTQQRKYDRELDKQIGFSDEQRYAFYCDPEINLKNQGVFEWLDICETVDLAKDQYTFVELGAGFGRWSVIAYGIAALLRSLKCNLILVEAEPTHVLWAKEHLTMNNIPRESYKLFSGAVDRCSGYVWFAEGKPSAWYGQSIIENQSRPIMKARIKKFLQRYGYASGVSIWEGHQPVRSYSLSRILKSAKQVDLIHMDIQGKEYEVLEAALAEVTRKVRRVHIGTHSNLIEKNLRELMNSAGWQNIRDYERDQTQSTPFGPMFFDEGIQTWMNPKLCSG